MPILYYMAMVVMQNHFEVAGLLHTGTNSVRIARFVVMPGWASTKAHLRVTSRVFSRFSSFLSHGKFASLHFPESHDSMIGCAIVFKIKDAKRKVTPIANFI